MSLKEKLKFNKHILSVSGASGILDKGLSGLVRLKWKKMIIVVTNKIDYDYFRALNIKITEGREFSRDFPADLSRSIIVNVTFVKTFDLKDPVGKPVTGIKIGKIKNPVVIGVAKDFNYTSLHENIRPLVMHMEESKAISYVIVKMSPEHISKTLASIKTLWSEIRPDSVFEYFFLEDDIRLHYQEEERWNAIVGYSSIFAIFIATLGLFGLTWISIVKRFKEIGIRKVLGASSVEIIKTINKEFFALILVANLIVCPVAYIISKRWLENFAYRTTLSGVEFIISGVFVMGVAIITMSSLAARAFRLNPVIVLRDE